MCVFVVVLYINGISKCCKIETELSNTTEYCPHIYICRFSFIHRAHATYCQKNLAKDFRFFLLFFLCFWIAHLVRYKLVNDLNNWRKKKQNWNSGKISGYICSSWVYHKLTFSFSFSYRHNKYALGMLRLKFCLFYMTTFFCFFFYMRKIEIALNHTDLIKLSFPIAL